MIRDKDLAKRILDMMDAISGQLNESIRDVQQQCSDEEFKAYRRAAGRVMGYAYLDVMVPLYLEHREFIPEGLNL